MSGGTVRGVARTSPTERVEDFWAHAAARGCPVILDLCVDRFELLPDGIAGRAGTAVATIHETGNNPAPFSDDPPIDLD